MKIYTKTGDKGQTGLLGGARVSKNSERIHLYGEVDELNSFVGLAVTKLNGSQKEVAEFLILIQNNLFKLGSLFACIKTDWEKFSLKKIEVSDIVELEVAIDKIEEKLKPLSNFILPGGSEAGAVIHVCRTTCRRVERSAVLFQEKYENEVDPSQIAYLNRLSDYFFDLARYVNFLNGKEETIWKG